MLNAVDLFCGAGGMSLGLTRAGFTITYAAECDPWAVATYRRNLGNHVRKLNIDRESRGAIIAEIGNSATIDLVAGGPPCQGFSTQRRGETVDSRNNLTSLFFEIAFELEPTAILFENVPAALGARGHVMLSAARQMAASRGYQWFQAIRDAQRFGAPQVRKRAIVVCLKERNSWGFHIPSGHGTRVTVRAALSDLPEPFENGSENSLANHEVVNSSELNIRRIMHVPEGGGRLDLPPDLQLPCHRGTKHRHLDVFGRMRWDAPAPTITASFNNFTRGRFAHPTEHRTITAREGARLQTFPDDFVFEGPKKDVARQIGNAAPPVMIAAIAKSIAIATSGCAAAGVLD